MGLLSHYRFRLEAKVESAAAGYRDEAEAGRSRQEGGQVRHVGVPAVWFARKDEERLGAGGSCLVSGSEVDIQWLWEAEYVIGARANC